MQKILTNMIIILIGLFAHSAHSLNIIEQELQNMRSKIVGVSAGLKGSGTLIQIHTQDGVKTRILTNSHVVAGQKEASIQYGDQNLRATVEKDWPLFDVAVLAPNVDDSTLNQLADNARLNVHFYPNKKSIKTLYNYGNEKLAILGNYAAFIMNDHPQSIEQMMGLSPFQIVDEEMISGAYDRIYQVPVLLRRGVSGGGYFSNGQMVGMITKISTGGEHFSSFVIPIEAISKLISNGYNAKGETHFFEQASSLAVSRTIEDGRTVFSIQLEGKEVKQIGSGKKESNAGGDPGDGGGDPGDGGGDPGDGGGDPGDGGESGLSALWSLLYAGQNYQFHSPLEENESEFFVNNEKVLFFSMDGDQGELKAPSIPVLVRAHLDGKLALIKLESPKSDDILFRKQVDAFYLKSVDYETLGKTNQAIQAKRTHYSLETLTFSATDAYEIKDQRKLTKLKSGRIHVVRFHGMSTGQSPYVEFRSKVDQMIYQLPLLKRTATQWTFGLPNDDQNLFIFSFAPESLTAFDSAILKFGSTVHYMEADVVDVDLFQHLIKRTP
jgi:hypothetical protein